MVGHTRSLNAATCTEKRKEKKKKRALPHLDARKIDQHRCNVVFEMPGSIGTPRAPAVRTYNQELKQLREWRWGQTHARRKAHAAGKRTPKHG